MKYYVFNLRSPYCEQRRQFYVDNCYYKFLTEQLPALLEERFRIAVDYFADDLFPFFEQQYRYEGDYLRTKAEAYEAFFEDCLEESDYEEITTDEYRKVKEKEEARDWEWNSY